MHLFFDTETTGLENPQLVQLAYILSDGGGRIIEQNEFIVKPEGFDIPADAVKFHGITTEIANEKGIELLEVLANFKRVLIQAEYVVAHNIDFDTKVMDIAFEKIGLQQMFLKKKLICTANDIKTSKFTPSFMTKVSNRQTLSSLYYNLFKEKLNNAHTAKADTLALYKCFWLLKAKNLLVCN